MENKLVLCPACFCMVHPKREKVITRYGMIMSFYTYEYNCPKCEEKNMYYLSAKEEE